VDTTWSTNNKLRAPAKGFHIITESSTTNTSTALDVHEFTNAEDIFLDLQGLFTSMGNNKTLAGPVIGVYLL
jgi:hypothetical protein